MSQQINLFNPIFLQQQKQFSATTMAQALGLILLGAVMLIIFITFRLSGLNKEVARVDVQLALAQGQLAKLNAEYAEHQKSNSLEGDVQSAEAEVKSLHQVFESLQKNDVGNRKGYSEYLQAFSRQIIEGLWLTGFSIYGAGKEIAIEGRTLRPELVPAYVNRLKNEPVMQGKSFATLEMQVPAAAESNEGETSSGKPHTGYIEFSLRSSGVAREQQGDSGEKSK